MASSGARRSDIQPHTASAATSRTTRSGLRALPAITLPMTPPRSGSAAGIGTLPDRRGRSDAALGRDEEVAGGDDDVTLLQAAQDLGGLGAARADGDLLRPQPAV